MKDVGFVMDNGELKDIKDSCGVLVATIEEELKKGRIRANVFVGGSFAKGTMMKGDEYDIDVFVRFEENYSEKDISGLLWGVVAHVGKKLNKGVEKVHGSRDYFQIKWNEKTTFEIVPVVKIRQPKDARNVTDLSYFHVNYIKKKLKGSKKLIGEIILAKKFCKANGFYGAESYIGGFSGYALECLVLHYKSFDKMLKELVKVGEDKKLVVDMERKYKTKESVFIEMNESKLKSPVVLVDPTWKERNVLAGLNWDTFRKFQEVSKAFLKKPSAEFFGQKKLDVSEIERYAKSKNAELVSLKLKTDRQEGDIAGTKMKKFSNFLVSEIEKFFDVLKMEFCYSGTGQIADVYYVLRNRREIIKEGPPLELEEACKAFIELNGDNVFEKKGRLYAHKKINASGKEFLTEWIGKNGKIIREMGIVKVEV